MLHIFQYGIVGCSEEKELDVPEYTYCLHGENLECPKEEIPEDYDEGCANCTDYIKREPSKTGCPEYHTCAQIGKFYTPPPKSGQYKLAIIFDSPVPNFEICKEDTPGGSPDHHSYIRRLLELGISGDEIYVGYAIKCPLRGAKAPSKVMKACRLHILKELEIIQPKCVLLVGAEALKTVTGRTAITADEGKILNNLSFPEGTLKEQGPIFTAIRHPSSFNHIKEQHRDYATRDRILEKVVHYTEIWERQNFQGDFVLVDDLEKLKKFEEEIVKHEEVAIDIETTSLCIMGNDARTLCVSFTWEKDQATVIPWDHRDVLPGGKQEIPIEIHEKIKSVATGIIETTKFKWVTHNGKYDMSFLRCRGTNVQYPFFDTMLAHYIAVTEELGTHGLKELAWIETKDRGGYEENLEQYLNGAEKIEGISQDSYENIPLDILWRYNAIDTVVTWELFLKYKPLIEAEEKWKFMFYKILMEATASLGEIEERGVLIDSERVEVAKVKYHTRLDELEQELSAFPAIKEYEEEVYQKKLKEFNDFLLEKPKSRKKAPVKQSINFNSTTDLKDLFFNKLGLKAFKTTDKKKVKKVVTEADQPDLYKKLSVDKESLDYMAQENEIPKLLLEQRALRKLVTTYVDPALEHWVQSDGRVHASHKLHGTVTSRIAVADPNLQNLPSKYKDVKGFFIPTDCRNGGMIVQLDFSQAELRVLACYSKDKTLIDAYAHDRDVHSEVAALVLKKSIEEVTKDDRTIAKGVNFGLIYGRSPDSLAEEFGMSKAEAKLFVDTYFAKMPRVKSWTEQQKRYAKNHGFVVTKFGFRRRLRGIWNTQKKEIRSACERQAQNAPIQGTSAMFTIYVLSQIHRRLKDEGLQSRLMLTVHDSIVADVYSGELEKVSDIMLEEANKNHFPILSEEEKEQSEEWALEWQVIPMKGELEVGYDYGHLFPLEELLADD